MRKNNINIDLDELDLVVLNQKEMIEINGGNGGGISVWGDFWYGVGKAVGNLIPCATNEDKCQEIPFAA